MRIAFCKNVFGPKRGLYFSDMGFPQEKHTNAGLADASANRKWKAAFNYGFLEWQFCAIHAA